MMPDSSVRSSFGIISLSEVTMRFRGEKEWFPLFFYLESSLGEII